MARNRARARESINAERVKLVYIGPNIPFGRLRSSMILEGTEAEVAEFIGEYAETYPEIRHLLVTPEELAEALDKVGRKESIMNKYYGDMLAKTRVARKG